MLSHSIIPILFSHLTKKNVFPHTTTITPCCFPLKSSRKEEEENCGGKSDGKFPKKKEKSSKKTVKI